jgi:hypothetical protein
MSDMMYVEHVDLLPLNHAERTPILNLRMCTVKKVSNDVLDYMLGRMARF